VGYKKQAEWADDVALLLRRFLGARPKGKFSAAQLKKVRSILRSRWGLTREQLSALQKPLSALQAEAIGLERHPDRFRALLPEAARHLGDSWTLTPEQVDIIFQALWAGIEGRVWIVEYPLRPRSRCLEVSRSALTPRPSRPVGGGTKRCTAAPPGSSTNSYSRADGRYARVLTRSGPYRCPRHRPLRPRRRAGPRTPQPAASAKRNASGCGKVGAQGKAPCLRGRLTRGRRISLRAWPGARGCPRLRRAACWSRQLAP